MNNVYDIKLNKNLNYILPLKNRLGKLIKKQEMKKTAVIIHLHYLDTIDIYLKYMEEIPKEIDIFLTTSNSEVQEAVYKSAISSRKNFRIIVKQNRGRDISALLVACREYIKNYEYICFLHDKKEKTSIGKKDVEKWNRCLWENMIGSREYIYNILVTFYENPCLGLLSPPFIMGEYITTMYESSIWYNDFVLTKKLAEKMNLQCDIQDTKPPITLGTIFWARVPALKKLFEIEWKYKDFDKEPLNNDGTISHAIERILAYVAQDAGFESGWVMTDRYMGEYFEYMQNIFKKTFLRLKTSLGVWQIAELDNYENKTQDLSKFIGKYQRYFIYGAGVLGKRCLTMLINEVKGPEAFLVSDNNGNPNNILGIPVYSLTQVKIDKNCGIIIAVSEQYQEKVCQVIRGINSEFGNIYFF